ncbi:MAG: type II toxin-antitoxin system RelE/ParE family toxin [Elusimicrobia bacterium]|nr:type II toxin-antitoxin system RelE/ParE family toxin [Elusimicrobiota bacterium]
MALRRRYYPNGDSGEVREYLEALRQDSQRRKAAVKLDIDLQTLELFWPKTMNVTVRTLKGWEPLKELKRRFDKIAYRIFFCIKKNELWLLSAYEKESDDTPRNELEKAYKRMKEVLEIKP